MQIIPKSFKLFAITWLVKQVNKVDNEGSMGECLHHSGLIKIRKNLKKQIISFRDYILNNPKGTTINLFHRTPKVELIYPDPNDEEVHCFVINEWADSASFQTNQGPHISLIIYRI